MNYKTKECLNCRKQFTAIRSDAKYCGNSCKTIYNRKKKAIVQQEKALNTARKTEIKQQIEKLELDTKLLLQDIQQLNDKQEVSQNMLSQSKLKKSWLNTEIKSLTSFIYQDRLSIYNKHLNKDYLNPNNAFNRNYYIKNLDFVFGQKKIDIEAAIDSFIKTQKEHIKTKKQAIQKIDSTINNTQNQLQILDADTKRLEKLINSYQQRIQQLEKLLFIPVLPTPKPMLTTPLKATNKAAIPNNKAISGADLIHVNFERFTLPTELGEFLGNLERYMLAIALTGDSGTGKTNFSFALASLFSDAGFKVKYYSLEMGICGLTKELIERHNCYQVDIVGSGKIADIKKDTKYYDVIIIDSFGKLDAKHEDFDKLRNAHPSTIFIFIFQKTSSGTIRGGASIRFDSSMVINLQFKDGKRTAIMEKSRYGTQGFNYLLI